MSGSSIHVSRTSSRLPPKSRGSSSEAVSYQLAVPVAAGLPRQPLCRCQPLWGLMSAIHGVAISDASDVMGTANVLDVSEVKSLQTYRSTNVTEISDISGTCHYLCTYREWRHYAHCL